MTDIYSAPQVPAIPAGDIPLAYISLAPDMTEIAERHIFDLRPFFATNGLRGHDHTVGIETGGQLEADQALRATGIADGYVLTASSGSAVWMEANDVSATYSGFGYAETTSTSFTTLMAAGEVNVTPANQGIVLLNATMVPYTGTAGNYVYFRFYEGSTALGTQHRHRHDVRIYPEMTHIHVVLSGVSVGTHTYLLKWRVDTGGSMSCDSSDISAMVF